MNSEQTNEIAAALAKAQGVMANAKFNKVNPHFKNKYADLAAIIDGIRQPFADNGIGYTQVTHLNAENEFLLITKLMHASGQWIQSEYPLPFVPDKPQVLGAALTYARRYELAAICGIAAEEDNDAEGVAEATRQAYRQPSKPKPDVIQGVEGLHGPHVNAPSHDPETGEIVDAGATTEVKSESAGIPIQDMAREAAERGRGVMRQFYKSRSKAERIEIDKIRPELDDLVDAAETSMGEGS